MLKNSVNSWGAGGRPSANKHVRKEGRAEADSEQIFIQTKSRRGLFVLLAFWPELGVQMQFCYLISFEKLVTYSRKLKRSEMVCISEHLSYFLRTFF